MSRSLLSPVWKCVSENRVPRPIELNSLATKILREAFEDESAASYRRAEKLAYAALEGQLVRSHPTPDDSDTMCFDEGSSVLLSI